MTVEEAVVARLLSLGAVTALVSTRVYLDKLPQSPTYPCLRVTLISEQGRTHLRGADALKPARVQVDAYARENSGVDPYALVATVAAAVHGDDDGTRLEGWAGEIGSPASRVHGCHRVDRRRSYGASGWTDNSVWILSKTFHPKTMHCSFTALNVEPLITEEETVTLDALTLDPVALESLYSDDTGALLTKDT